jgi:hypothetical protein
MQRTPTAALDERKARSSRRTEYLWAVFLLVVTACFYGWTATSAGSPFSWKLQHDDLYNRLADGLLAGRLSFVEQPDPALAKLADPWDPAQNAPYAKFHDVTYFNGSYYLYFGAAPAVLLLAPWKLITGTYLGQNVAAAVMAWIGAAATMAVILCLKRRHFPHVSGWIAGLALTMAAFGNLVPVLLRRPVYYELAIASAFAFAMVAILGLVLAQVPGRRRRLYLALAGAAYGLAIGSRPNYLFGSVVLVLPLLPALRDWWACVEFDPRPVRRDVAALALPFLGLLALILLYNGLRFGRVTEFGTSYMLAGLHPVRDVVTTFRFLPVNLWFYLFPPSQWIAYFPFFDVIHMPWFSLPAGYIGEENIYGVLTNLPWFWMLFAVGRMGRDPAIARSAALRDFALATIALVGVNALVIGRISAASSRYLVDLLPPLVPLSCLAVFWLEDRTRGLPRRLLLRTCWIGALVFTALFNVFVSFQHNDLLKFHNPTAYRRLAHAFNHVSTWIGATAPDQVGPLDLTVTLPTGRTGLLEPLVVTGLSFKADFVYLYYTDESHLQIGFEHTSYGGPLTKPPLAVDYSVPHTFHIELGSLYPPVDHPCYDRISQPEVDRMKHTLRILLDGQEVLSGTCDFYDSSPGDVSIGRNPVSEAFGRRFTGKIMQVHRGGLTPLSPTIP